MQPEDSILKVRRSIHINADPEAVWREFTSHEKMDRWWGAKTGDPKAGSSQGQWLDRYDAREGGRIEMAVDWDGERVSYGGDIIVFAPNEELTFENDWIPNRGWEAPTFITLRLNPILGGAMVELYHHGFERTGGNISETHEGYETGWGMTQLLALKKIVEQAN